MLGRQGRQGKQGAQGMLTGAPVGMLLSKAAVGSALKGLPSLVQIRLSRDLRGVPTLHAACRMQGCPPSIPAFQHPSMPACSPGTPSTTPSMLNMPGMPACSACPEGSTCHGPWASCPACSEGSTCPGGQLGLPPGKPPTHPARPAHPCPWPMGHRTPAPSPVAHRLWQMANGKWHFIHVTSSM
jgi:hypothetical protein